jgi:hypothetical protein
LVNVLDGHLKVNKPSEDICGYCYRFHNRHKYSTNLKSAATGAEEGGGSTQNSEQSNPIGDSTENADATENAANTTEIITEHNAADATENPADASGITAQQDAADATEITATAGTEVSTATAGTEVIAETGNYVNELTVIPAEAAATTEQEKIEQLLLEAAEHVKMARAQRSLLNAKVEKAREDSQNQVSHATRTRTLVVDYGQNMAMLWFGASQPGEVYYYTPLNTYNLGIVNTSHSEDPNPPKKLLLEGQGAKGGDNGASLIMKTLHRLGWLDEANPGYELVVCFDNCPGQNKNNFVLRHVPHIVEMGYFKKVDFIFLVAGHTKNCCNRWFNQLKSVYRVTQSFTMEMLTEGHKSEHVKVFPLGEDDMKKYGYFLSLFYRRLPKVENMTRNLKW